MNRLVRAGSVWALLGFAMGASVFAQDAPERPFKIQVRHADPWVVKALIEGVPVRAPEASTIPGFAGFVSNAANASVKLLQSGYLVVNPTDNSLWYFPRH